jgi:tetratricopeptide (TPR) repeat protein
MRFTVVLFVFALVILPVSSMGQDTGGSSATPQKEVPHNLQNADQAATTKRDYPAESVIVEQLKTIYRYSIQGTGSREISTITLIQSDGAARQYGVVTIPFAGNNQRVEVDYLRVRKPNGTVVETPATDVQEMPQEITRQAPFYSDLKEKQIPVRNLQVGDRLEYKIRIVDTKAEIPGQFWGQESFGSRAVILDQTIELHVPKTGYVKVWSPDHPTTKTDTADELVYRWTGSQLEPTVGKDGKAIQKEIDPSGELPTIAWTTFKSWEDVGSWYQGLEADRVLPDATVKAKAAELTAGKSTDSEKAQALYNFVATQIRYIGVAFGVGRYQPHSAGEVLQNQYGDCKDKHTLLAAMLFVEGLHPKAALIGAGIRMNEEVPSPASFNHMITFVPIDGAPVWLDSTSELAPYRMLISFIRDKQALVVPATGPAKIEKTPIELPFKPFSSFVAAGTLTKEGTVKAKVEFTERGDDELLIRTLFRQIPRGQWNELMQRLSQGFGFGGVTSDPDATRPESTNDPIKLAYNYEREKTGDWENHRILPLFPIVFLPSIDDKNPPQKQPIQLGEPRVETSLSTIELPSGWGAELPSAVHEKAAFATFDKIYKIDHEKLTTERRVEILERQVPALEWKAYKKWLDATLTNGEPFIQLIPTAEDKSAGTEEIRDAPAQLVRHAYEQVERGEINGAETTLNKAKEINTKQKSLWSTYGFLNFQRRDWNAAIAAYKKEISLYPDTLWVYIPLSQAQMNSGHFDDALETLRMLNGQREATDDDRKRFAGMLAFRQKYEEALPILQSLASKSPDDGVLGAELGGVQLKAGHTADGEKTLITVLTKTSDPYVLNSGADELANAGIQLDLAEKSARKAIDTLTTESTEWKLDTAAAAEEEAEIRKKEALLVAAWDTLGWTFYHQGRLQESESYLQASWKNSQSAEVGLHLGELSEKRGKNQEALHRYKLAFATTPDASPVWNPLKGLDPVSVKLRKRMDALKEKGVSAGETNIQSELTKQRTISLGTRAGGNLLLECSFVIANGKIVLIRKSPSNHPDVNEDVMLKRANFEGWIPQDSDAHLLRKGTLNCHSGACELVVYPM